MTVDELIDRLSELSIPEALELARKLEQRWGVSSLIRISKIFNIPEEPIQHQTEFSLILEDCGPKKIEVIKAVRELTNGGLKESKDAAETPGFVLLKEVDIDTVMYGKNLLEKAGARVRIE